MEQAVDKFIKYLKMEQQIVFEETKSIEQMLVKKYIFKNGLTSQTEWEVEARQELRDLFEKKKLAEKAVDIEALLKHLTIPKSDWKNYRSSFMNFPLLGEHLAKSKMKVQEKLEVVCYLLEKNLEKVTQQSRFLLYDEIADLRMPNMSPIEFKEFILGPKYLELVNKPEENQTIEEKEFLERLEERVRQKKGQNPFMVAQKAIQRHYLNSKENYTEKDVQIIFVAFKKIGLPNSLCEAFSQFLLNELKKRITKEENDRLSNFGEQKSAILKSLSSKEKDKIFKEIMDMYNIQEHKIIKALTKDEIVYLVSRMLLIHIPEKEIKKAIQNINWHGLEAYGNPVKAFNDYYEKIKKHSDIAKVAITLKNMEEYLNILSCISENSREYLQWMSEIAEELKRIRNILNQDDTYELEEGRKRNLLKPNEDETK